MYLVSNNIDKKMQGFKLLGYEKCLTQSQIWLKTSILKQQFHINHILRERGSVDSIKIRVEEKTLIRVPNSF